MPHEHINSTPAPRDIDTGKPLERATVRWTRAEELPGGELATGDITIATEWLKTDVRFPTPEMFDVRIKYEDGVQVGQWITSHTYGADEPHDSIEADEPPCRYCGLPEDRACHAGSETYCDLTGPTVKLGANDDPALRAARARSLGVDEDASPSTSDSPSPWSVDPSASTYRDAIQVIHRTGAPTWTEPCTGFWITLTRDDANHLIRKLRRAVQEAHGGDA